MDIKRPSLLLAVIIAAFALVLALPASGFADAGADTAGNSFTAGDDSASQNVEGDLYWAGQTLDYSDATVGNDILAAGESLAVTDSTVGGAIRMAGRSINISGTEATGSVTVAGENIVFNKGSKAAGVYAAARTVNFLGRARAASLAGDTVTLDGTIDGDVEVYASKLIIGKHAKIDGIVTAHVSEEPERASGAQVGELKIDRTEEDGPVSTVGDIISGLVFSGISTAFVAILLALILPRAVRGGADMLGHRPMPLWITGIVGVFAMLPVMLMLLLTIAGASFAGALVCGIIGIALVSASFTGAGVAALYLPKMNRYLSAAIGGFAAGALTALPWIGGFVSGVCFVFALGYAIQTVIANARGPRMPQTTTPQLPQF